MVTVVTTWNPEAKLQGLVYHCRTAYLSLIIGSDNIQNVEVNGAFALHVKICVQHTNAKSK